MPPSFSFSVAVATAAAAIAFPGAAAAAAAVNTKLPYGVIAVPLSRDDGLTAYFAELHVGTPPQKELLKIDTGSPRYSFLNPRNPVCNTQGNSCTTFGTFDNETSSTCRFAGINFADDLGWVGEGDYLTDTVTLGGVTTKDMYFGYTSDYAFPYKVTGDVYTILGLALECSEAGPTCTDKVSSYMLPELKNASKINYIASSIYLGPDDKQAANAQMLLGGAYDKAKVDGDLFTLDMVDPFSSELSNSQTNTVNVASLEVVIGDGKGNNTVKESFGAKDEGVPVLLDTGTASWYMTDKTVAAVWKAFGGVSNPPLGQQYTVVDCKYADPKRNDGYIVVGFGFAGKIKVPLHGLVSKFPDGTCGAFLNTRGDSLAIFGDAFLRNVYSIYDQENFSVTLGQVKHTSVQNIVPFPKGGFKAKKNKGGK